MQTSEEIFLRKIGYSQVKIMKYLPSFTRQVSLCSTKKKRKEYVVVKYYKYNIRRILTDYMICGLSLAILRPIKAYASTTEKIRGAIMARKIFRKVRIETPQLIYPTDIRQLSRLGHFVVEKYEDARPLTQFVLTAKNKELTDIAYIIGVKTASLHKLGYAFGDNRASNTLIKIEDDKIHFIKVDHEYFCWDPYKVFQILDIILITQYPGIPKPFVDGFFKGYSDSSGFDSLGVNPEYFERASYLFGDILSLPLHFIKRFE